MPPKKKVLTFVITGVTDPTVFEAKIESLIEGLAGLTTGLIDVVVEQINNNTFEIVVYFNGENPPSQITDTVKGDQFSSDLMQQTGASIVPGSITEPTESPQQAGFPFWGYILIGIGCLVLIGIVIAVIIYVVKTTNPEIV
jgi:hypothetical protein